MRRFSLFLSFLTVAACHDVDRKDAPYIERQRYCTDVECVDDTTCTSTLAPHCLEGVCSECGSDSHCTAPFGFCRDYGVCVCSEDEACVLTGEGAACVQGACVECGDGDDCLVSSASVCYGAGTDGAFCGCARPADCAGIGPGVCDQGLCSTCGTDGDCDDPTPKCFQANSQLAYCGCADDGDCAGSPDGESCLLGVCGAIACNSDGDCASTPDTPMCFSNGTFDAYCGCTVPPEPGEDDPPLRVLPPRLPCMSGEGADRYEGKCVDGECAPIGCKTDADCSMMDGTPKCIFAGTISSFCGCGSSADCDGPASNPQECRDGECLCSTGIQCNSSTVAITVCI